MPGFVIEGGGGYANGGANGKVETRRKYRWRFSVLESMPTQRESLLYLRSCNRPEITLGQIEQHHNQERIWHLGKTEWNDLTMRWYDIEQTPDMSANVYNWLKAAVYDIEKALPYHPTSYKKTAQVDTLKHDGTPTESWILYHSWPYKINWSELDYTANDLLEIEATLKYDRAVKSASQ